MSMAYLPIELPFCPLSLSEEMAGERLHARTHDTSFSSRLHSAQHVPEITSVQG